MVGYGVRVIDAVDGHEYSLIGLKANSPTLDAASTQLGCLVVAGRDG